MEQLIKYIYIEPLKRIMIAEKMAQQFLKTIISNHGILKRIASNKDRLFATKFWTIFIDLVRINHKMTTAYHLQGNDQIERINQTIEQYLQYYINYK